jgi:FkbM family methyltransferase
MLCVLPATVPVELEVTGDMQWSLDKVLAGEYDAPYQGTELTILDIGANVGAFALWANLRWPRSTIHAYEPGPGTFAILERNVGSFPNILCSQVAVYPSEEPTAAFFSRYDGDGGAGLVDALKTTFKSMPERQIQQVPVISPRSLPRADIVKIDAEGSECEIIANMDLAHVSLLMVEYTNLEARAEIRRYTQETFEIEREDSVPSRREMLVSSGFRNEVRDDRFGTLTMVNRKANRLRHMGPTAPPYLTLRQLLHYLPAAAGRAIGARTTLHHHVMRLRRTT